MHVYDSDEYYNFEFWLVNIFWTHFFDKFVHFHELGRADGGQIGFFPTEPVFFSIFLPKSNTICPFWWNETFRSTAHSIMVSQNYSSSTILAFDWTLQIRCNCILKNDPWPHRWKITFTREISQNRPEKNLERPKMIINWNCKNI